MVKTSKKQPKTHCEEHISFESLLTRRIYDDIHGFVSLTPDEKQLLSNPYMRRLHFIKQNALANFVFPGATHTRFSHSVGVLHIVEKMIQRLKSLPKEKINITEFDHQIIRLAALLHDVGHYPLSHTIEDCFKKYDQYFLQNKHKEGINPDTGKNYENIENTFFNKIENIRDILKDFSEGTHGDSEFHHEIIAKTLISNSNSPLSKDIKRILANTRKALKLNKLDADTMNSYLHLIGQLICGNPKYTDNTILTSSTEESEKYFILSLLINSDLDADQMDYMLRDTKNTGIQTTIRIDFLIDNMDICYIKAGKEFQPVLCFNYKAIESVQQFIFAKAYWYTEIILYDKVCILNKIAKRLYMYILHKNKNFKSIEEFQKKLLFKPNKYIHFTDLDFWNNIFKLQKARKTPRLLKYLIDILIGNKDTPYSLSLGELQSIKEETENNTYFKTNINQKDISTEEKNELYKLINKKLNDKLKIPIYFSNKFFKPTSGEHIINKFINRSIYILTSPCNGQKCKKECLNAVELLNSTELGTGIIHKLLNIEKYNSNDKKQAYINKCVVYQFDK